MVLRGSDVTCLEGVASFNRMPPTRTQHLEMPASGDHFGKNDGIVGAPNPGGRLFGGTTGAPNVGGGGICACGAPKLGN